MAESFFSSLKTELIYRHSWTSRHDAELAIFAWIETSHQPKVSSSGRSGCAEGEVGAVGLAGGEAVVQLGEHGVEQLPERCHVPVAGGASGSILCFPVWVVADGCHGPDVTGGGDAVVLGSSSVHVPASA
jgi:hypothetical protein